MTGQPAHELIWEKNGAACTGCEWRRAATEEEAQRMHAEHVRAEAGEFTCPWCGDVEPNEMLLRQNHWVRPSGETGYDWCAEHKMCIGQELVLNHLRYAIKHGFDSAPLREQLAKSEGPWEHAKPEHRADADALFAEARARLAVLDRASTPPEHHAPVESEAVSLW